MDKDLMEIQQEIDRRKQSAVTLPEIPFEKRGERVQKDTPRDVAGALVDEAFGQAVVAQVANNTDVQTGLLQSADKVIKSKVEAIKSRAEQEEKEAHFNNKKNACECFGYNEATTQRWAVDVMNWWHNVMTAIWLCIGFFTFAPITFVAKKITVIFKKSWVAVTLAIIIYLAVLAFPVVYGFLRIK